MKEETTRGPGVYSGMPFREYLALPYASNSQLTHLLRSPLHLKAYREEPLPETKALKAGRAIHAAVLEPELFERDYVAGGQCAATTSKGGRCSRGATVVVRGGGLLCSQHANGEVEDDSRIVLSDADRAMCLRLRDVLAEHPTASRLLAAPGQVEVSVVWDDPATGVRCKGRWDKYIPGLAGGTIVDLKSCTDARPHKFERSIVDYGYARQAMLYLMAARALDMPAKHYVLLAAEKDVPHGIMVYRLSGEALGGTPGPGEEAYYVARQVRGLLRRYDECTRTNDYPGYPTDVRDVSLPDWAWNVMDAQTMAIEEATTDHEEIAA